MFDDIDPQDIDPDTGRPYASYSSPSLEPFTDDENDEDEGYPGKCSDGTYNHHWNNPDSEADRCYCMSCGADGDA